LVSPQFNCTQSGGKATGVFVSDELASILLTSGELSTVSSI
jgi:hypothetical protein